MLKHKFWPFLRFDDKQRRFYKNKSNVLIADEKLRPIMYASHRDAAIMSFYSFLLKKNYESKIAGVGLEGCIIAYRKIPSEISTGNKSNIDFAKKVYELLKTLDGYVVFCLDVKGYFENINHLMLREKVMQFASNIPTEGLKPILKAVTKYRYIFRNELAKELEPKEWTNSEKYNKVIRNSKYIHKNKRNRGIPQGSPISDILSNIYLYEFDLKALEYIKNFEKSFYMRYCDDIIIAIPKEFAQEIYAKLCKTIKKSKVEIKQEKTEAFLVNNDKQIFQDITKKYVKGYSKNKKFLQYLGFDINLKQIKIRSGTIVNLYRRSARIYDKNRRTKATFLKKYKKYSYLDRASKKISNPVTEKNIKKIKKGMKKRFRKASEAASYSHKKLPS